MPLEGYQELQHYPPQNSSSRTLEVRQWALMAATGTLAEMVGYGHNLQEQLPGV